MYDVKRGLEVLRQNIKIAPDLPGVYRMINKQEEVLYVGKAKNIKKRIISYTHIEKLTLRLQKMVSEISRMEFVIVENENRALIVENELIKKYNPKYNILLKDDKSYPYLAINVKDDYPRLCKYRGVKDKNTKYFGPYASVQDVKEVMDTIQKIFMLRSCRDNVFITRQRPCLLYQIKRCSAPCVNKVNKEEYRSIVNEVILFLEGKTSQIQEDLSQKMLEASNQENFEKAIVLREKIKALTSIQTHSALEYVGLKSVDVVALAIKDNYYCIEVFFIRNGENCGNLPFFFHQKEELSKQEITEAFLSSFYFDNLPPKEIFIKDDIENIEFMEKAIGAKISVIKKGNKNKVMENAINNAKEALERKIAENKSIEENLKEMMRYFDLPKFPERIEVYDNSHNQGSYAIGAMIVATPSGFDKKSYRTFNIKNKNITNDDFAMMKEVLGRRFERMSEDNRPDVILLDGGIGQLTAVYDCLKEYNLDGISIIAISKGVDRNAGREFYHQQNKESFSLPYRSSIAFYLQKLRDEAHRFAIGTHRKKRAKSITKSSLDDIEGIGTKRKKDILNHFGSVSALKDATIDDIIKVSGISKKTAENIYKYFHK
ncbi:MAG: excinuclease ABC subunit UvrC [Alphaproteobacteria bacterium]|nr:excinuclease ABC subunit UvrC [Alphaproteobacteria bacterium]